MLLRASRRPGQSFSVVIIGHLRPPPMTCGALLKELESEFEGAPLMTAGGRAAIREGRGRRSLRTP